jgi:hypothetical protein
MESAGEGGGVRSVVAEGDAKRGWDEMNERRYQRSGGGGGEMGGLDASSGSGRWWWVRLCVRVGERASEGGREREREGVCVARPRRQFLSRATSDSTSLMQRKRRWNGRDEG